MSEENKKKREKDNNSSDQHTNPPEGYVVIPYFMCVCINFHLPEMYKMFRNVMSLSYL